MSATVIDSLPGGLLDLLAAVKPPSTGRAELTAGRAQKAADLLACAATDVDRAWWYVATHSSLLTFPDGGALPFVDPVDPRPAWPVRPDPPPEGDPAAAVCWMLTQLCVLRDVRGLLPPLIGREISPREQIRAMGDGIIENGRREYGAAWPALIPQLDLLAADLAARAEQFDDARSLLTRARSGFAELDAARSVAATAVVSGDWHLAPFTSPVTWGFSLGSPTSEDSSLPASTEEREQAPGDPVRAAADYDAAEALYRRAGDGRGVAVVQWRRAYLLLVTGDPERAREQAESAAGRLMALGDNGSALLAGAHAALAGLTAGQLPDAAEVAAPIIAWGTRGGALSHSIAIGRLFSRAGRHWVTADRRPERAMSAFEVAEAISNGLGRCASRSQALVDQAHVLAGLGAQTAALVMLNRGIDSDAPMEDPPDPMAVRTQRTILMAADLYNLANAAADVRGIRRAQQRLRELLAHLREHQDSFTPDQSAIVTQLSSLLVTMGQDVVPWVLQAQQARDDGDPDTAADLFARAEGALADADPGEVGMLTAIIGMFELRFEDAAAVYRPWLAQRLADIESARPGATSPAAEVLIRQAERQQRDQGLMFAVRARDVTTATAQLNVLRSLSDPWWAGLGSAWEHEEVVGRLLELSGDLAGAGAAFGRVVAAVEAVRSELRRDDLRQAFGAERTVQQVYRGAARVELRRREAALTGQRPARSEPGDAPSARNDLLPAHDHPSAALGNAHAAQSREPAAPRAGSTTGAVGLAAHHARSALRLLELGRCRALSDLMTAASGTGLPAELLASWRGAAADVALRQDRLAAALAGEPPDPARRAAATAQLAAAQQLYQGIEEQLREREPLFWRLASPSPDRVDPIAVLAGLSPGHAVLMYSFDRPDLLACGLTRDGMLAAHWSREERRIDHLADRLLIGCAQGQPWTDLAAELAAILLEPLAAALEGAGTVHIIASGATLRVPFAVLPWQGRPLGRQFTLTTLPSLSAYPLLMPAAQSSAALVVGDPAQMVHAGPDGEPQPLRDLPGAAVEAAAVARVLGATPLIGGDATESAVRSALPAAGVVHLATHGVLDPDTELASAVVLANGDELTVAELLGLHLQADLVVLSACQTGTGKPVGGDELLGLGRGLLAAGARSALVTLWPVDDVSAALVMAEFHSLRAAGMPTARALQEATNGLSRLTLQQARDKYTVLRENLQPNAPHNDQPVLRTISTGPPATAAPYAHPLHWAPYVLIGA